MALAMNSEKGYQQCMGVLAEQEKELKQFLAVDDEVAGTSQVQQPVVDSISGRKRGSANEEMTTTWADNDSSKRRKAEADQTNRT